MFDEEGSKNFSKANPERQCGVIKRVWKAKRIVQVEWADGTTWINDGKQLRLEKPKMNVAFVITCDGSGAEGWRKPDGQKVLAKGLLSCSSASGLAQMGLRC